MKGLEISVIILPLALSACQSTRCLETPTYGRASQEPDTGGSSQEGDEPCPEDRPNMAEDHVQPGFFYDVDEDGEPIEEGGDQRDAPPTGSPRDAI